MTTNHQMEIDMSTIDEYRAARNKTIRFHKQQAEEDASYRVPQALMSEDRYFEYRRAIEPVIAELQQLSAAMPDTVFSLCCCPQCAPTLFVSWTDGPTITRVKPRFERFPASPYYHASFVRYRSQPGARDTIDSHFIIPMQKA